MISEFAPAKVNLALHVTGRRADGYHAIETLAVFCDCGDRLTIEPADEDGFDISGPFAAGLESGSGNLVVRARDALRRAAADEGHPAPPVSIHLHKALPLASGLGGGSADGAAALRALSRLWQLDDKAARRVAPALGADVPMCLESRSLIARGVGEAISPLGSFPQLALVLANPGIAVSTPAVFSALTEKSNPPLATLGDAIERDALPAWLADSRNDLQTPAIALAPAIAETLDAIRTAGASFVRMSGSGATCFGLFDTDREAEAAARTLRRAKPGWYVTQARTIDAQSPNEGERTP